MDDRMVSFVIASPSGFAPEYRWGVRVGDDTTWQVEYYDSVERIWGHPQMKAMESGRSGVSLWEVGIRKIRENAVF